MKYLLAVVGASLLAALPVHAAGTKTCQLKGSVMVCDSGDYPVAGPMADTPESDVTGSIPGDDQGDADSGDNAGDEGADAMAPDVVGQVPDDSTDSPPELSPDAMLKCIEANPYAPCQ